MVLITIALWPFPFSDVFTITVAGLLFVGHNHLPPPPPPYFPLVPTLTGMAAPEAPAAHDRIFVTRWYIAWLDETGQYESATIAAMQVSGTTIVVHSFLFLGDTY